MSNRKDEMKKSEHVMRMNFFRFIRHPFVLSFLCVVFLLVIRFYPIFFQQKALYFGDNYSLMIPGKMFTANWIKKGTFPLWNPYIFSGIPWIGDMNQSPLYFSTLFYYVLPAEHATTITVLFHELLAFYGMYALVLYFTKKHRYAFLGGVLWMFSSPMTGNINNLATIQAMCWAPLIIRSAISLHQKKWWFVFIFSIAAQIYAGYPQFVGYTVGFSFFVWLYVQRNNLISQIKKWFVLWAVAGVIIALLSAPATLPFLQPLTNSTRVSQSVAQSNSGSLDPKNMTKIFLQYLFDKPNAGIKWGPNWNGLPNTFFYVTWIGIFLPFLAMWNAGTRKKILILYACILVFVLLSFGERFPFFSILQRVIPFLQASRGPSHVLFLANICAILACCFSLEYVLNKMKKRFFLWILIVSLICLSGTLFFYLFFKEYFAQVWNVVNLFTHGALSSGQFHTLERDRLIARMILENILVSGFAWCISIIALQKRSYLLLAVCIIADLMYSTSGMLFFGPNTIYQTPQSLPFTETLQNPQYRTLTRNANRPYADFLTYWEALMVRVPFSDSFIDSHELATNTVLYELRRGYTPDWNMVDEVKMVHGYTTLLPNDYAGIWNTDSDTNINSIDMIQLENPLLSQWAVRYYLVDSSFVVEDAATLSAIAKTEHWTLYELPALSRFRFEDDSAVSFSAFSETPNSIHISFDPSEHSSLIVADRYDSSWRAWVNGKETPIVEKNGMRRIALPQQQGQITVRFQYMPKELVIGAFLFFFGSIVVIFSFFVLSMKPRDVIHSSHEKRF